MSLSSEYKRQSRWRDWPTLFDALPPLQGQTVLDLGCGVGDQAVELVARGARVIGVESNGELLHEARSLQLADADFRWGDLRNLPHLGVVADGLWCSFAAAYLPNLSASLEQWKKHLRPGGWIALTEIDDFFGHEPLGPRSKSLFEAYAEDALRAGRYDFHMGRKLRAHLERSGWTISKVLTVQDQELSFDGPAAAEIVEAWRTRLDRMTLLRDFCGPDFERAREEFLGCLASAEHRSLSKVVFCLATRPMS